MCPIAMRYLMLPFLLILYTWTDACIISYIRRHLRESVHNIDELYEL